MHLYHCDQNIQTDVDTKCEQGLRSDHHLSPHSFRSVYAHVSRATDRLASQRTFSVKQEGATTKGRMKFCTHKTLSNFHVVYCNANYMFGLSYQPDTNITRHPLKINSASLSKKKLQLCKMAMMYIIICAL